jgi:signal transduction histidine kinase
MTIARKTEKYICLLESNKEFLMQSILRFVNQQEYTNNLPITHASYKELISSITELLEGIVKGVGLNPVELSSPENFTMHSASFFVLLEEFRCRYEGSDAGIFLALVKYYRQCFTDIIERSDTDQLLKKTYNLFTNRCFDWLELGLINRWFTLPLELRDKKLSSPEISNEISIYHAVFENLIMPVIIIDDENRIANFNRTATLFFHLETGAVLNHEICKELGSKISILANSKDREYSFEINMETTCGIRYFKVLLKKLPGIKRKSTSIIIMLQDLTEYHNTELNLQVEKSKAIEADRIKTAFLANMSHEIRTPMNAIIGFTELLLNRKHSKVHKLEYLNLIRKSSKNLLNIIEDIIDITKMESKQLKIKYKACKPYEIFTDLKAVFDETLRKYDIDQDVKLILKVSDQAEKITFFTDGERLKQVVSNLLNNAVKYTSKGWL